MANKIKKGDEVVVIAGDHKGSKGKILEFLRDKNRVLVEGVNLVKKHEKKTQDNPQGAIVAVSYTHLTLPTTPYV